MLKNRLLQLYLDEYHGDEAWYNLLAARNIRPDDYPDAVSEIKAVMTSNVSSSRPRLSKRLVRTASGAVKYNAKPILALALAASSRA